MWIKNNRKTTVNNYDFKGNCKTTVCNCGFKDIFVSFKITVTNGSFLHLKIKIYVNIYVNKEDYFDKYFEMGTIFTFFFFTNKLFWS